MECKKCGKNITQDENMAYCPYCANKLDNNADINKSILRKEVNISDGFKAFIAWLLMVGILAVFFALFQTLFEDATGYEITELFTWISLGGIACVALYFTLAYIIYNHAKKRNRRAVAWATVSVVFSPIVAVFFYLLSWPKEE